MWIGTRGRKMAESIITFLSQLLGRDIRIRTIAKSYLAWILSQKIMDQEIRRMHHQVNIR